VTAVERQGRAGCRRCTTQGFEYDWSGVIIGPDLVVRNGRMVTVRDANKDPDFKRRSVFLIWVDGLSNGVLHGTFLRDQRHHEGTV
jgi:hypothetical protein